MHSSGQGAGGIAVQCLLAMDDRRRYDADELRSGRSQGLAVIRKPRAGAERLRALTRPLRHRIDDGYQLDFRDLRIPRDMVLPPVFTTAEYSDS